MAADVTRFEEFAGSARGLIARLILPNNAIGYKVDVQSISYAVNDVAVPGTVVTGSLDPDDVCFATAQVWNKDSKGYTFLWDAPGSLWPTAGKYYRIAVTFTLTAAHNSRSTILVWEVQTHNPKGD